MRQRQDMDEICYDKCVDFLNYTTLSCTYLFVRMRKNPQVYGIKYQERSEDPQLHSKRRVIINDAARSLDKARMIRYDARWKNC